MTKAPVGALTQPQQACHRFAGLAALGGPLCSLECLMLKQSRNTFNIQLVSNFLNKRLEVLG